MAITGTVLPRIIRSYQGETLGRLLFPQGEWRVYERITGDATGGSITVQVRPTAGMARKFYWSLQFGQFVNQDNVSRNFDFLLDTKEVDEARTVLLQGGGPSTINGARGIVNVGGGRSNLWFPTRDPWEADLVTPNVNLIVYTFYLRGYLWEAKRVAQGFLPVDPVASER